MKPLHIFGLEVSPALLVLSLLSVLLIAFLWSASCPGSCSCGASNGCCPCPNQEIKEDLLAWGAAQRAQGHNVMFPVSSAGSWLSLCEDWKEAMNRTEPCFQ
jgi:hypothetical protein